MQFVTTIVQHAMVERLFEEFNLDDPFFDSLKNDYVEFSDWFRRKGKAKAYAVENTAGRVEAFLHLKNEVGSIEDVSPALPVGSWIKLATFKVNAHGTRLGERLLKKAFDQAIRVGANGVYVTVFPKHAGVISLFEKYGFKKVAEKTSQNGVEWVLSRPLVQSTGKIASNFPAIPVQGNGKFLLGIYPEYHTRLFPDSILNNENIEDLDDISHTNSIHKIYVCWMDLGALNKGDVVVIYRTGDKKGPAYYRAVATSICVVEEVRGRNSFENEDAYVKYCKPYSVFSEIELRKWWSNPRLRTIRMTYNAALLRRLTRQVLIESVHLDQNARWGLLPLSESQFSEILKLGKVNASIIVNQA